MRRLLRLATCVMLMGCIVLLQGQTRNKTETVGYLCGKLIHLDSRTAGGHGATLDHTSPLPDIVIKLYPRDQRTCCGGLEVLGKVTTGKSGEFKFADAKLGTYWLVATVGGREFKLPLRLVRPDATSTLCQNQDFEIEDSGKFRIMRMAGYL